MVKPAFSPWHKVCDLRDDIRSGELTLASFAADLYDVHINNARPVYQDPKEFFALTYPTHNLRELTKDVLLRLAGKNDKAVRQLQLTYGGGKTHTLITLYHLVNDPERLPKASAVTEFLKHAGLPKPPAARVGILAFDKLDIEVGMDVRGPKGKKRRLRHPWSVLAYQLGDDEGLKILTGKGTEERESAPAENVLRKLIELPREKDLATLVLLDEVLMFAYEKVRREPAYLESLKNFFQCLTQAVAKTDRSALVASLLATDTQKNDEFGGRIAHQLASVFMREQEEGVTPVTKDDVAELLRRRFFTPESILDKDKFRPHVIGALQGIRELDEATRKEGPAAEKRYLDSYPFHPSLTEIFYGRWTNLEGYQRTRGVLRTFAMALRDAEKWDTAPLVGANVFLSRDGKGLSEAARELAGIASRESYEGKRQEWTSILETELDKARAVQGELPALRSREVEQGVFATFIQSQPIGQRAHTRDLLVLLGHTRPDRIELEKGLKRWTDTSWFLDDAAFTEKQGGLPKWWRLGNRPNLKQMHTEACQRVSAEAVEASLREEIARLKRLTEGAAATGARVHALPTKTADIDDDGEFHFAVLGPKAASDPGRPSDEARRFINEKTGPESPRVYRNALVLAVPSKDGLDAARSAIRERLGWEEVANVKEAKDFDEQRRILLRGYQEEARRQVPSKITHAYCLAVTVGADNEIVCVKLGLGGEPLFSVIKSDGRLRVHDKPVTPEALLPGGPYDLWQDKQTSMAAKDLVGKFYQFPQFPKMPDRQKIIDTLNLGARTGAFALRSRRADKSIRCVWRQGVTEQDLRDPSLEVVLAAHAELTELGAEAVAPGGLPGVWKEEEGVRFKALLDTFAGGAVLKQPGTNEPLPIPKASRAVVEAAVRSAVKSGTVWVISGGASLHRDDVPEGILTDESILLPPPAAASPIDLLPETLGAAWAGGSATAGAIAEALSQKLGRNQPWSVVHDAIDGALRSRLLEVARDSGPWPCDAGGAPLVKLRVPSGPRPPQPSGVRVAESELTTAELQSLGEEVGAVAKAAAGCGLRYVLRVEVQGTPTADVVAALNAALKNVTPKLKLE